MKDIMQIAIASVVLLGTALTLSSCGGSITDNGTDSENHESESINSQIEKLKEDNEYIENHIKWIQNARTCVWYIDAILIVWLACQIYTCNQIGKKSPEQ